jgi:hypothetical protein
VDHDATGCLALRATTPREEEEERRGGGGGGEEEEAELEEDGAGD